MVWKPRTWFLLSLLLFVAAGFFWRLGEQRRERQNWQRLHPNTNQVAPTKRATTLPMTLLSVRTPPLPPQPPGTPVKADPAHPYRLSNTTKPLTQLLRTETAILLRNALWDTAEPQGLAIPEPLRAKGDPGSYIVQARGLIDDRFRSYLTNEAGATVIAYVPNNAYLVRVTSAGAEQLKAWPGVQAVLPYEPYYKLDDQLLALALAQQPLPPQTLVRVTLFPDQALAGREALVAAGATVVASARSPFGPLLTIEPAAVSLANLAQMPAVEGLESYHRRVPMNDLARPTVNVSADSVVSTNYLDLTGTNVLVNINDTGVDASHPALQGRVTALRAQDLTDPEGHGTHVAGTIAGDGSKSDTVTNAMGSVSNANFRGMAPAAKLFVLPADVAKGPAISDNYLQEGAARTNAFISNNSWGYSGSQTYDSSAASYDAAVRDALPTVPGPQPVLFVFSAGNAGAANDDGTGGDPGTVVSPGTAKNVITVGAIEQFRNITNEVIKPDDQGNSTTNFPFLLQTDSSDQVAGFSARGNVGLGTEGPTGRFKPDVVAPGTFVVSTKATGWEVPLFSTNQVANTVTNQQVAPGALNNYYLFVPLNAVQVEIAVSPSVGTSSNYPGLPIYVLTNDFPTASSYLLVRTNDVLLPRDGPLMAGDWYYSIGNRSPIYVNYDITTIVTVTNAFGNYYQVLSNLDASLGPYYRYESGTSMSAPVVSGMLALMKEFFEQKLPANLRQTNSPALMKALLINGARSVNPIYDLQVQKSLNAEGWGLVNLTNSLPAGLLQGAATNQPLQYIDQSLTNALATGESKTWKAALTSDAQGLPMRITLVWTDPPGDPNVGVKLVNDLDLIVTNLDTGDVYWGNDIPQGSDYNQITPTNSPPNNDMVNNVENVFLNGTGTNLAITVSARRVNVNAVPEFSPSKVVQDFALVLSSDNLEVTNAFTLTLMTNNVVSHPVTVITNGVPLLHERVAANPPALGGTAGATNQWNFYVFTNVFSTNSTSGLTNGSNVAFITFLPPNLAVPRNIDADIDLYVSTNSALTNLDPAVLAGADKSVKRGGTELVFYTNAPIGQVYYVGVKSEDQQACEYGFIGLSSNVPFDRNVNGSRVLTGLPFNVAIPDGSPDHPGTNFVFAIATTPITVGRVVVTNVLVHQDLGDLLGNLSHNRNFVVLNNHTLNNGNSTGTNLFVYDDSNQGDLYGSRPTDGPGSLNRFTGDDGTGLWMLTEVDDSLGNTGRVQSLSIRIDPKPPLLGLLSTVLANSFDYFSIDVPEEATNLLVTIWDEQPNLPLYVYVRRADFPTTTIFDKSAVVDPNRPVPTNAVLTLGLADVPPLTAGRYFIGVFNPNAVPITYRINASLEYNLSGNLVQNFLAPGTPLVIADDAVTYSTNYVSVNQTILDVRVGVRVDHPRVSDLVLHLISPQGTRILLTENRGGATTNGFGGGATNFSYLTFTDNTNLTTVPIKFAVPPFSAATTSQTNLTVLDDGFEAGAPGLHQAVGSLVSAGWQLVSGDVKILTNGFNGLTSYQGNQCLDLNGTQRGDIVTNLPTVPGREYILRLAYTRNPDSLTAGTVPRAVVNLGTNAVMTLVPDYTNTFANLNWQTTSTVFTASSSTTRLELKSLRPGAAGVLVDAVQMSEFQAGIYYQPEEPMTPFLDQPGIGNWILEVLDDRAGATNPVPRLLSWQLQIIFATPTPTVVTLTNRIPYVGTVAGNETKYFLVNVPAVASWATNILVSTGNLILFGSRSGLPVGDPAVDDYYVFPNGTGVDYLLLGTNEPPLSPLQPGSRYYLGVRNNNPNETNAFVIEVDFDKSDQFPVLNVTTLLNNVPFANTITNGPALDYYQFLVSSNAASVKFDLYPTNGNLALLVRKALPIINPLPTVTTYDYQSHNPGTNADEVIVLPNSTPVPLGAGVWYLGVVNTENFPVTYSIVARESTFVPTNIVELTNGVPLNYQVGPGPLISDYFHFLITDTNTQARFQLFNLSGNADFVVALDRFPTALDHDFADFGSGANAKEIVVNTNAGAITPPAVTNLVVYGYQISSNALTLNWVSVPGANYSVQAKTNLNDASWSLVSPSLLASDTNMTYRVALPSPYQFFEVIQSVPRSLANLNGDWYLAVLNNESLPVSFTIRAVVTPVYTFLTNSVTVTNTVKGGPGWHYYQFDVSSNATMAMFSALPLNGDVDLYLRKATPIEEPWPTLTAYDAFSAQPGTTPEAIILFTNSSPVALAGGTWYWGVYNPGTNAVDYTLTATEYFDVVPPIFTLANGVPHLSTLAASNTLDYYQFVVDSNATQVTFQTTNANGNVDLYARWGLPLPGPTNFLFASTNAGASNELISLSTTSAPVTLTPGPWFLSVANADTNPVTYTIVASEVVPVPATNLVIFPNVLISNGFFVLTWNSVTGATYQVQGRVRVTDPGWNIIASNIVATASIMSYSVPLTNPNHFFRVVQVPGGSVTPPPVSTNLVINPRLVITNNTFVLTWASVSNYVYNVQGRVNITDKTWNNVATNIVATGPQTSYAVPLPNTNHYFQIVQVATAPITPPPVSTNLVINPHLVITNNTFVLTWASVSNYVYNVQGRVNITDKTWNNVATNIVATGPQTSYAVPLPNTNHYFQIVQVATAPITPPPVSTNLVINPHLVITNNTLVLTWASLSNQSYQVQGKVTVIDKTWNNVSGPILATGSQTSYAVPLSNTNQYFRVVQLGGTPPITVPTISLPNTTLTTNGFVLHWSAPASETFHVQFSTNLTQWTTFTNVLSSATGQFQFTDDGSQSGGLAALRFYRLILLP